MSKFLTLRSVGYGYLCIKLCLTFSSSSLSGSKLNSTSIESIADALGTNQILEELQLV